MAEPLFTFAIIADTHINPVDGESGSPWPSNRLANDRFRWAVDALNADRPDFVLHLGDMVHPIPDQPGYGDAVRRFEAIAAGLDAPLTCLPGNHDMGDKPGDWMPAHPVSATSLARYQEAFGPLWQAFDHGDARFILHANPLLGSGLPEDDAQWDWLAAELEEHRGRRIFFFTHYPLFLAHPHEPEHYDNLAPDPRERLRRMLCAAGVEAVFAAHVHTIFHTPLAGDAARPMQHVVPTLSAMRLDYSHLFKAPPEPEMEHGRNDAAKLGYYLVNVHPDGYRLRFRRSHGATRAEGGAPAPVAALPRFDLAERRIGVDLRQGWADPRTIPYSGVVDEFGRKSAHNDYLLTALQEAGLRDLRVPLDDLRDAATRARMRVFAAFGHRFQPFTLGPPEPADRAHLADLGPAVARVEVVARRDRLPGLLAKWRDAVPEAGPDLVAAPLWTSADAAAEGASFTHVIGHGFTAAGAQDACDLVASGAADGAVFRVPPGLAPDAVSAAIPVEIAARSVLYVTLGGADPATLMSDDAAQADRVRAALAAVADDGAGPVLIFDTLEDLDRGYFPRHGLYDVRFNPRAAAGVLSGVT